MTLRIQVLVNFGGVETNGLRIPPGEYAIDDDRLLGCGQMLVDRGQARVIGDEPHDDLADRMLEYAMRNTNQPAQPAVADVTKQVDEAFAIGEESAAVDEILSDEAENEQEDNTDDDPPQVGRKRKAR